MPKMAILVGVLLVAGTTGVLAKVSPEQKCADGKSKASGLTVYADVQCHAAAASRGTPVDPACVAKVESKATTLFGKADGKGSCSGEAGDAIAASHACAAAFSGAISGNGACVSAKLKATGGKVRDDVACVQKAIAKGVDVGTVCEQKSGLKFGAGLAKADTKGVCTGTAATLGPLVAACVDALPLQRPCAEAGWATCDGGCPSGKSCRPFEVFEDGASIETGCSCVDVVNGPECGDPVCGADQHCPEPGFVCEQWTDAGLGCDHTICQPAMTTPTTLPPDPENPIFCGGVEFPTCGGGTCPGSMRCQAFQAFFDGVTLFAGCLCGDPAGPRCEASSLADCHLDVMPFSHCADPSKTCLVTLEEGDPDDKNPLCSEAHCGDAVPTTTSTSLTTTTSTSTSTSTSSTSTSTSTTTTTLPCVSTPAVSGNLEDLGDCTVLDHTTGLQWEQKQNVPGPHHVNNKYVWGGCCSDGCATMCQPNAAASATCMAMAEVSTDGCGTTCPNGEECYVERGGIAITTIFDWVNQLNAENFAGHSDWRVPTEAGSNGSGTRELSSILVPSCPDFPCVDPIFGPTIPSNYWSRTSNEMRFVEGFFVNFFDGGVGNLLKREANSVRAVRGGS